MPNGDDLYGYNSGAQGALAVPMPNNPNQYYLFTQSGEIVNGGTGGLKYSIVDMTLPGNGTEEKPFGDVTDSKNIALVSNTQENLAATSDNENGYWVITHSLQNDGGFYAFHIDGTTGVLNTTPVRSGTDHLIGGLNTQISTIKFNSFSNELAHVTMDAWSADIWEFDNSTGRAIGSPTTISPGNVKLYGAEYSANGKYVYINEHITGKIYRYDVTAVDVQGSQEYIGQSLNTAGALQMGSDGNIYVGSNMNFSGPSYLGVISNSDANFFGDVTFDATAVELVNSTVTSWGLPNFPSTSILRNIKINHSDDCSNTRDFDFEYSGDVGSVEWNFGEFNTTSTALQTTHTDAQAGTYTVTLTIRDAEVDIDKSYSKEVVIGSVDSNKVAGEYCYGETLTLEVAELGNYCFYEDEFQNTLIGCGDNVEHTFTEVGEEYIYVNGDKSIGGIYGPTELTEGDGPWGSTSSQSFTIHKSTILSSFEIFNDYSPKNEADWFIKNDQDEIVFQGTYTAEYQQAVTLSPNVELTPGDYTIELANGSYRFALTRGVENSELVTIKEMNWTMPLEERKGYIIANWKFSSGTEVRCKPIKLIYFDACITSSQELETSKVIYPNPFTAELNIDFEGSITIYEANGSIKYNGVVDDVLSTEGWLSGMYIIQYQDGDLLRTEKVVKQ